MTIFIIILILILSLSGLAYALFGFLAEIIGFILEMCNPGPGCLVVALCVIGGLLYWWLA